MQEKWQPTLVTHSAKTIVISPRICSQLDEIVCYLAELMIVLIHEYHANCLSPNFLGTLLFTFITFQEMGPPMHPGQIASLKNQNFNSIQINPE